jgi:PPE-repeat protein
MARDLDRLVEALITEQRDNVSAPPGASIPAAAAAARSSSSSSGSSMAASYTVLHSCERVLSHTVGSFLQHLRGCVP